MLLTTYQYCATAGTFVALPAMPKEVPLQVSCAKQALAAINQQPPKVTALTYKALVAVTKHYIGLLQRVCEC